MNGMITHATEAREFVLSCNKFLLVNTTSDTSHVFQAATPKGQTQPHFIRLCGDTGDDLYIGTIFDQKAFRLTAKSPPDNHPAVVMFGSFWSQTDQPFELDGFHLEPYEDPPVGMTKDQFVEAKRQVKTPSQPHPTDSELGQRAYRIHRDIDALKKSYDDLEKRIAALEAHYNVPTDSTGI